MDTHERLANQVTQEQDDVLATLQLVQGNGGLEERLYDQLVDLLVEGLFLELRKQHLAGEVSNDEYIAELGGLSAMCRQAGLLPLPTRDSF